MVVVFPFEPVTQITGIAKRLRCQYARLIKAERVSSTQIMAAESCSPINTALCLETIIHPAPLAMASATKLWPSKRFPEIAIKISPFLMARESMETPLNPL